ncbi:MAG: glycosyltransferase 4 family protein [Candidatus Aenigmatarchaeota archaeon]
MSFTLLIAVILAFATTAAVTPKLIAFNERIGLTGVDIHKATKPRIAESGGVAILCGALIGSFGFIWMKVFVYGGFENLPAALAALSTILIAAFIGFFDDLFSMLKKTDGKTGFKRIGLPQWAKPLLMVPAAIPLMAIMAGEATMVVPFFGAINFGILFPLLLVPLAVVGASNATNMLAGLNGLEVGLGAVLLGSLGLFAAVNGQTAAMTIALPLAGALAGFFVWNRYPARIMPGDSVSYIIGAAVATVAVIGNMERFAVLSFAPWFLELMLKSRGCFKRQSFGILRQDGTLALPYPKVYSLTHVMMRIGHLTEKRIVLFLIVAELVVCATVWVLYWPF